VQNAIIKTTSRRSTVTPEMVGLTFAIFNGRTFIPVKISEKMVGFRLGDLLLRSSGAKKVASTTPNDRKTK
jgi:ribosomal protein S19